MTFGNDPQPSTPSTSPMSSPLRSSPLSNPPIYSSDRLPSPSKARPIPRRTSQPTRSRASLAPIVPQPSTPSHVSVLDSPSGSGAIPTTTPSPPLSRSHPLLGSYSLSLIHSRMSHAHQPHSSNTTFSLHIKAVGQGKRCPPELRCPKPLDLPFPATYYDLEDSDSGRHGGKSQTPWVGTIDLEQYYYDQYQRHDTCGLASSSASPAQDPPDHPGYHVAPVGQLQMIVKTPTNAIKAFLVPYDLRALPIGGRLLAMEQTFVCAAPSHPSSEPVSPDPAGRSPSTTAWAGLGGDKGKRKESLRYAYQLQFVCLAAPKRHTAREGSTTRCPSSAVSSPSSSIQAEGTEPERAYYLSKTLKVIFTSTPPELDEQTRTERTDEIVPSSTGIRVSNPVKQRRRSSAAGIGAGTLAASPSLKRTPESWELVRLKWLARRDMLQDKDHDSDHDQPSPRYHEPDNQSAVPPFKPGVPGRAPTPVPQPFKLPNSAVATPTKPPPSPRFQRRQLRRTSAEERELSEKLRNMGLE